ncbi:cobalt-precorrin-5B (C(1))-methyltransferase CbiD [Candidatus Methanoprimaticola sp. MG2]|uniref:cobalt-precorrin-5B (C(1))-methyltransferase CbiD n=1 Tax=Candidatus Methanoprimaticola sp. MG2 TaxID=3228838 RepID=UPI0039C71BE0
MSQDAGPDEMFIFVNNRRLRRGHTTGTCAAAASKGAALALLGEAVPSVRITTPKGITLDLPIEDLRVTDDEASCAVRKDGGDDIDATSGTLVYSTVSRIESGIEVDGGTGVGRVTRKGLDQPPGNAAINRVPRSMIREALEDVSASLGYTGGLRAVISVPEGMEIARKTFNPRLGIVDGISILGTSGIVEPMSETALIDTVRTEMRMRVANGAGTLLVVPGNYGKDFSEGIDGIDPEFAVKCSNFVGEMLDCAVELGVDIVLVSNLGKMVKLAGGIMNTHSRNADARMEILASNGAMAGASLDCIKEVMGCISTDDALEVLDREGLIPKVSEIMMGKIEFHMNHRTGGAIRVGAVMFSSVYGLLGKTSLADELLDRVREESQ